MWWNWAVNWVAAMRRNTSGSWQTMNTLTTMMSIIVMFSRCFELFSMCDCCRFCCCCCSCWCWDECCDCWEWSGFIWNCWGAFCCCCWCWWLLWHIRPRRLLFARSFWKENEIISWISFSTNLLWRPTKIITIINLSRQCNSHRRTEIKGNAKRNLKIVGNNAVNNNRSRNNDNYII